MDMDTIPRILESKYHSEVLAYLLMAPARSFSVKELAKRLHMAERRLLTVLKIFERLNLVKIFRKDKRNFYMVNSKHKLLPTIKQSLLKNQKRFEDELFVAIKKLGEIRGAFLSGVFTGEPTLPVDLLLVGKVNLKRLSEFLAQCKKWMGVEINYSIMNVDEFRLRRDTFDRFLRDIFDYKHLVVFDNTIKRK